MSADRWQLMEALYHRAAALPAADRPAFLERACAEDRALIAEVSSLLQHSSSAANILDAPALHHVARAVAIDESWVNSSSLSGRSLSHYQVHEAIGRGGMGVIYKAKDVKLGRWVALKLLPDYLLRDPQALQRFEREARAASALNHPNICTVYEIDQAEQQPFIAIELLEGESLRDRIGRGPVDIATILRVAIEVCGALDAAHSSGIVHRDIKPGNLFITHRGITKVLDFGAAKRLGPEAIDSDAASSISPDLKFAEQGLTLPGSALGTVEYMSPEQASGQPADPRSDIFSLGLVIYEMATGQLPWTARTSHEGDDPRAARKFRAMKALRPGVPPGLEHIVAKALAVERANRYQRIADLRADLEGLQVRLAHTGNRWKIPLATLALAALIAAIAIFAARQHRQSMSVTEASAPVVARSIKSLAVLPFRHASDNPAEDVFADAMARALIEYMARLGSVRVASIESSNRFKDTQQSAREISRELNVDALIEGAVSQIGGRIQASVQLIDGASELSLWQTRYEKDARDVLQLQRQMAVAIAREVKGTLSARDQTALAARVQTVVPAAYEAFLRGNYFQQSDDADAFRKADESYRKAMDLDPSFAAPYIGAAESLGFQAYSNRLPPGPAWSRAESLLAKAVALDPESALAHTFIGMIVFQYHCDRERAEKELNLALELSPGNLDVLDYHSYFLMEIGRWDEGIAEKKGILASDPISIGTGADLGLYLVLAGRYDEAIEQLNKILELNPNLSLATARLGTAYAGKGEYARAVVEFKKSLAVDPAGITLGNLGYAYARWHKTQDALRVISQLKQASMRRYTSPAMIARIYAALGDRERALSWLDKAQIGDRPYVNDPGFDGLRSNGRFRAIAAKLRPSEGCPQM